MQPLPKYPNNQNQLNSPFTELESIGNFKTLCRELACNVDNDFLSLLCSEGKLYPILELKSTKARRSVSFVKAGKIPESFSVSFPTDISDYKLESTDVIRPIYSKWQAITIAKIYERVGFLNSPKTTEEVKAHRKKLTSDGSSIYYWVKRKLNNDASESEWINILSSDHYKKIVKNKLRRSVAQDLLFFNKLAIFYPIWLERKILYKKNLHQQAEDYYEDIHFERVLPPRIIEQTQGRVDVGYKKIAKKIIAQIDDPRPNIKTSFSYQLLKFRDRIISLGTFNHKLTSKKMKEYAYHLTSQNLIETEYVYELLEFINWVHYLYGGKHLSVKQAILGTRNMVNDKCRYCDNLFTPSRKGQITCGSEMCKKAHQNNLKRQNRRSGRYK